MKVTALGEFGLIAAVAQVSKRTPPNLIVGIGDDAAVWATPAGAEIATADILLEGIHFTLGTTTWYDLGWKAIAVNLSDIAAMGGTPRYALLSIALPESTEVEQVEELYLGATAIGDQFGTAIVGGDTVRSLRDVMVSVAVIGSAEVRDGKVRLLRRNAAQVGDLVAATGKLGGAAGGLAVSKGLSITKTDMTSTLRVRLARPRPRVSEAHVLLASGVKAAMDISDGLVGDLAKLCQASSKAAVIDLASIPVDPALEPAFPDRALGMALYGGEDYELLFTCKRQMFSKASEELARRGLVAATAIGEIIAGPPGTVWLRDKAGQLLPPEGSGYDAFTARRGQT